VSFLAGWETVGVSVLLAVLGILQQADWIHLVPMQYIGATTAVIGGVMFALRMVTNTPVGGAK
jgi:threonine/homoserine efflux transporter RhtA